MTKDEYSELWKLKLNSSQVAGESNDQATAKTIVAAWKRDIGQVVKYERMESDIATALTTARKEARSAAFKGAIQIAKEEAFERRLAHTVYERLIEAAANREEGGGDG